ncbi:MAG TPA: NADH-quinone oxidoreductase subunit D [Candidatus Omnitrophota bacterium]|nr:NADH-quinone oxidoreductase subunit D [Candidatus Omnitrophota bacterium]
MNNEVVKQNNPDPAAGLPSEELIVNMGPQHPSTHGVLYLELRLNGEIVVDCRPHIGYLHRSCEKIAENRTYIQFIPFTDRLDYLASMNNNLGYVLAVEKLLNLQVNDRVSYVRTIIAELNRIASHLVSLGTFAQDLGAYATPMFYCFRDRETIIQLFDELCGGRLTFNYMRIGGVQSELPPHADKYIKDFIKYERKKLKEYNELLTYNAIFLARTKKIGILKPEVAINYSVTGPNLRASGVKWDIRKDEPYMLYNRFKFDVPVGKQGDSWDRFKVKLDEIGESLKIVEQAIGGLPPGNAVAKINKVFKAPPSETYLRTENPRGELGFYLVSDGGLKPYRNKIRSPSFCNLAVLPELIHGLNVSDAVCVLGSIDIVMGEIDR